MMTDADKLRRLIAENKTERALQILKAEISDQPDLQNQIITLSAKFNDLRKKENIGLLDESELSKFRSQINFSVLGLIDEIETAGSSFSTAGDLSSSQAVETATKKTVFISYNHRDADIANKVKEKLTSEDINVIIDSERMQAGDDIKEFIENCVRETNATLSLISKNSLLSAWVAMESINTFYHEKTNTKKKFIACYINDDFFNRNFTDDALDHIDAEIKEIQSLITVRMQKDRSIRDLQNELTRMTELRNNLDEIIRRLRESLCIDIRNGNLENNFQKILQAIKS